MTDLGIYKILSNIFDKYANFYNFTEDNKTVARFVEISTHTLEIFTHQSVLSTNGRFIK